ncbi:hypothetical protein Pmani_001671 [Petrolisthes manimaculis]|uniref:Uncharacterized protein n=1 Tax=Petrolisthes manimaculis TaxID=1843537 RepID=A0AAE1QJ14_9EUCA|nr:hypothetical protein Pmani_001671 [Petrolisthes manimaculis]
MSSQSKIKGSISGGDVGKLVSAIKDGLHSEWAEYKKSKKVPSKSVCVYAIGGVSDTAVAALASVSAGVGEWEACLVTTVDPTVDKNRGVLASEVMVGAEGQVTLYPPRKQPNSEGGDSSPGSVVSSASKLPGQPASLPGSRKRPLSPKATLMVTLEQSANYMLDHIKRLCESAYSTNNFRAIILCLASAVLVRSRLNAYKDILSQPVSKNLTTTLARCGEVVEFLLQSALSYTSDLLHSALLHDAQSHDWTSKKPYGEGCQSSLTLQMWAFYMQGVRNDLWKHTSPRISESILASILTDTLSLLVTRYLQIDPSEARLPQYRADIIAILTVVASLLPSLMPSPVLFFSVRLHESVALPLHRRADLLLKLAAIKSAPIELLAKVFSKGFQQTPENVEDPSTETEEECPIRIKSTPAWLTFLNPILFPAGKSSLRYLSDPVAVYLSLLTAASRPQPQFPLIVRGLLMRGSLGTKTLLGGLQDVPGQVSAGNPCGGPLCQPHLCAPPLIPHTVYAAICQVLVQCVDNVSALSSIITPGIKQTAVWDSLDRTQVWNLQRPAWHHALVQLVSPSVAGVVAEVLSSVPPQPPARPAHPSQLSVRLEHHLAAWTLQLLAGAGTEAAQDVPIPVLKAAVAINALLPPTIKPTGGHVITQLVVSALYAAVNSRSTLDQLGGTPVTDGQWDMMIAVGERLCSLHDGSYDTPLRQMTHSLLAQLEGCDDSGEEEDCLDDYTDEEVVECVCNSLANAVLSTVQGQHALVVVWEFLRRNMEWVQEALSVPSILPLTSDHPQARLSFTPTPPTHNPLHYYNRIVYTLLDQESLMNFPADWESVLLGDLGLPGSTVADLVSRRPEFCTNPAPTLTRPQAVAMRKLKRLLETEAEEAEE